LGQIACRAEQDNVTWLRLVLILPDDVLFELMSGRRLDLLCHKMSLLIGFFGMTQERLFIIRTTHVALRQKADRKISSTSSHHQRNAETIKKKEGAC
jgi:hypothetical protein